MKKIIDGAIITSILTLIVYLASYFYQLTYFINLGVPKELIQFNIESSIVGIFSIVVYMLLCFSISYVANIIFLNKDNVSRNILFILSLLILLISLFGRFIKNYNLLIIFSMISFCFVLTLVIHFFKTEKKQKWFKKEKSIMKNLVFFFEYTMLTFVTILFPIMIPVDFATKEAKEQTTFMTTYINDDCYLFFEPNRNYYVAIKLDKEKMVIENTINLIPKDTNVEIHIESLGKINN